MDNNTFNTDPYDASNYSHSAANENNTIRPDNFQQSDPYQQTVYQPNPNQYQANVNPNPYQQNGYQPNPYQPNPYQPNPYQQNSGQNPYQSNVFQSNQYQQGNGYSQDPYQQTTYQQVQPNGYQPQYSYVNPEYNNPGAISKKESITSMVMGILALTFAPLVIGFIFGIIGIVKSGSFRRMNNGQSNGFSKAGKICGIIGIILSLAFIILWIVIVCYSEKYGYQYYRYYRF